MRSAVLIALALTVSQPVSAQEAVVFEGLPLKQVESSFLTTEARELNGDESFQYQVRIVERNGRYYSVATAIPGAQPPPDWPPASPPAAPAA